MGDEYLYEDDVLPLVPTGLVKQDSVMFVTRYIQNWAEGALIAEASSDSRINMDEIEERVEEYRRTLIYYAHVENVVAEQMDTVVTEARLSGFTRKTKAILS